MTEPAPVSETARVLQDLLLAHLDPNAQRDVIDTVIDYDGNKARHLCIVLVGLWGDLILSSHGGNRRAALKQIYGMCGDLADGVDADSDDAPIAPRKKPAPKKAAAKRAAAPAPKPGQKPTRGKQGSRKR